MLRLQPGWIDNGKSFWYRKEGVGDAADYVKVDSATGAKSPLFDEKRLTEVLSKELNRPLNAGKLPIRSLNYDGNTIKFDVDRQGYAVDLATYAISKGELQTRRPQREAPWRQDSWPASRDSIAAPDGSYVARIQGNNVIVKAKDGTETTLTTDGTEKAYYARLTWFPNSKKLLAVRVHPGDRKHVYLIQNTPPVWGPAKLLERVYDRPGDVVDTFDVIALDPTKATGPVTDEPLDYGDLPYFRATKDGALTYEKVDRGYGRWRVFRIDPSTGQSTAIIDDHPATFVDTTALIHENVPGTDEIVYSSERDGWHHLYLADGKGGSTQITKGEWVVRSVEKIDAQKRQILFTAGGMNPGEDPYFIHYYRINFDGTGLTPLTPAKGNHTAVFSPNGQTIVDTYSTVDMPPVHELRRADTGALVSVVEKGDISRLLKSGWRMPQPFVAKGRDGKTDIYGVVYRPMNYDSRKKYPVVEDIYAGPQDSFVPKSFSPNNYDQRVAELGFVVVKIDGMGTRNRSKAFHDVCYKNLSDAGFPDRILWMKALAKTDPSVDIEHVGIFGTSAGGQNAGAACLFHPEFYKVAVASCGCHDNRLDKIWWNEQWMGTMGPQYAACSNIENAAKLKGNLLLMVGELDTNVPPESTFRYAAALQAAGKEFDLVIIPNSDHTSGGPYGERKRRDFLVRHLLGVEPPNPNDK